MSIHTEETSALELPMPEPILPHRRPFGVNPRAHTVLSRVQVQRIVVDCTGIVRNAKVKSERCTAHHLAEHVIGLDLALLQGEITLSDEAAAWLSRHAKRRLNLITGAKYLRARLMDAYQVLEARLA